MIVIPAVDIRGGRCVQLVGGSYDREKISIDDPVSVAGRWADAGFTSIHVVDLDAATGRGSNGEMIEQIIRSIGVTVQVGGGIRTTSQVERLLEMGAARVVVGTRAIEDREWLEEIAGVNGESIIVAMDVRDRSVVTHGWQNVRDYDLAMELGALNHLPLAGLLVTAVHVEGQMLGPDIALVKEVVAASRFPIQASGGIATATDIRRLADAGADSAIVGMALYTGTIDVAEITGEFIK